MRTFLAPYVSRPSFMLPHLFLLLDPPSAFVPVYHLGPDVFGFVMLSGALSTLLLPETCGRSLEELSNEHEKGVIRGAVT